MSTNVTLIPQFKKLPIELVDQICLFTGKFIFDLNGDIKSIINIEDFKNIETLMIIHNYHQNKYLIHRFTIKDKIRFIQNLYSDRRLEPEERVKEEVLSVQNVDYAKQSYLFIEPSTIEKVMIPDKVPLDLKKLCNECCAGKLLTKNPAKKPDTSLPVKKLPVVNFGFIGGFGVYYNFQETHIYTKQIMNTKKKMYCDTCNNCNKPLFPTKTKSTQDYNKKIQKKSVKFDRLVKNPKVIKNFRRLN